MIKLAAGDRVTCKVAVPFYYHEGHSDLYPLLEFKPGMVAVVYDPKCPKVRIQLPDAAHDRKSVFIVADCVLDGKTYRVGLNYCNVTKVS